MKKKVFGFNSRTLFTITLVFALCCLTTHSWAAKKVDIYKSNADNYIKKLNQKGFDNTTLASVFGLTPDEEFKLVRQRTDANRVTHKHYEQTFGGFPVWGMQTVISSNSSGKVLKLHGTFVQDSPRDIGSLPKSSGLDPVGALRDMQDEHKKKDKTAAWAFRNETYGTYIYIDKKGKAYLAYVVSFFADNEKGNPSQFIYFIDAKSGRVLDSYDMLRFGEGTGPGGNLKVGLYHYGIDYPGFGVTVSGSTCTMNTTDVKTVDLNHGTTGTTAFSYPCYENTHEEINGGYCPMNDAQYFGQVVFDTYQYWYGTPVLPFQLTLRCHYSTNYENAFWDGSTMTFGDGYTTFYPLVGLDVVAHEVSHGFTEYNSGLIYSSQSGGINEAFSDMAGEGAEYYMRNDNDFMVGYDIFKSPTGALRYMYDPPLDGISIDHVDDYYEGLDVHYSSGIYNKVFYLVATSPGWDTHMAFDIFVKANQDYWGPSTNFVQGAEGVIDATVDWGYPCQAVSDAFAVVGIDIMCPGPPTADFTAAPTTGGYPLTVQFTDLSTAATSYSWDFGDTGTSTQQNPIHTYTGMGSYTVTLTVTNSEGSDTMTKTNYIVVTAPQMPVADFVADATDVAVGQSVTFTDLTTENPTSWAWTFEGGTPATGTAQNPVVTYNTVGTFTVTLTATNIVGSDTETRVGYINVAEIPYCSSQGNTYSMEWISRVRVAALDNSSGAAGYTDFTYLDCGLTGGSTVNVYLTPGFSGTTYTEYWRIWIDYNGDHDFEDTGELVFSGSGSSTVSGTFTVASGINRTTRMRVSMKYAGYPTPCETFTYGEVEDYTAIIGFGGDLPPVANFSASATTIYEGQSVTFTDLSTNDPDSWDWVFEGGTPATSTLQNPTVTYYTAGQYEVTLWATNAYGTDLEIKDNYITVLPANDPPVADFTFTTSGLTANFTDAGTDSDGTIVSWAWTFGDGGTSTAQNPSHTYAAGGTYAVTLTVTDDDGAADAVTKNVSVTEPDVEIYVYNIAQSIAKMGKNYQSTATVMIRNTLNAPVANATVFISWSGVVSGSASGVTGSTGTVSFISPKVKATGPFVITVTNVTHATYPYNPSLNIETTDTASY